MIDTLKIRLNDYEISKKHRFVFQPGSFDCDGNIYNENVVANICGDDIIANRGYLNNKKFNMTIYPPTKSNPLGSNIFLQMSLPKYHNENDNLSSLNYDETVSLFKNLEKELYSNGIKTNIYNSTLSRIDTFKNLYPDKDFCYYADLFSFLKLSRKKMRDYGTTFLFSNSDSEVCIYDKKVELLNKYGSDYINCIPSGNASIIRFENRLLKKRKINNELGFSDLKVLLTTDGYDNLKDNYYNTMKGQVFKINDIPACEYITRDKILNDLMVLKSIGGRNYFANYLRNKGYENLQEHTHLKILIDVVKKIEIESGSSKSKINQRIYNMKKMWEEQKANSILMKEIIIQEENFQMSSLYNELKSKMFSKAS